MKKLVWRMVCLLPFVPGAMAQEFNHFQAGAFADYFRSNETGGTNMFGLGGSFGVTVLAHVPMEAEMAYDFDREFSEGFTSTSSGGTVSFANTGVRTLHRLFGPKLRIGTRALPPLPRSQRRIRKFHV
jgi:hypothetical protein